MPLRFSFLTILTARKTTIFDENLINLMTYVLNSDFEGVKIYKLAEKSPVAPDQEISSLMAEEEQQPFLDGNEIYLRNEAFH